MEEKWARRKLLILGMTYPTYSRRHWETACTGALDEESGGLVRIYPLPRRYMDREKRFKNFQWISVNCCRSQSDSRPESFRIDPESVEVGAEISSVDAEDRVEWLNRSSHLFRAVRDLKAAQQNSGVSLGIVRPASVDSIWLRDKNESQREEWVAREREILGQSRLRFMMPPMRLAYIDVDIMVAWTDAGGESHKMALRTWGLSELYRNYQGKEGGRDKVIDAACRMLMSEDREVFMFLGSFHDHPATFGLMDAYCPKKIRQVKLF